MNQSLKARRCRVVGVVRPLKSRLWTRAIPHHDARRSRGELPSLFQTKFQSELLPRCHPSRAGLSCQGLGPDNVDFFRRHLDEMRNPEVMMTAVDFYSHHRKRFMKVEFRVSGIDLATQVFRAAYLDARNATYVTGPCSGWREAYANGDGQAEARRKRIFNADGHFAKYISNHVGPPGRRAIHSPGPLLWHL